jgi:hypothetical protein
MKIVEFFAEAEIELRHKNRFQNKKLDRITDFLAGSEANKRFIQMGSIYYRARCYDEWDAEQKYFSNDSITFKGYDKDNSFVNKNFDLVKDGRCNPCWIPYLYVSESISCCIHEIRPVIGSYVSVASIKINASLNILDLSTSTIAQMNDDFEDIVEGVPNGCLCQYLNRLFSYPYKSDGDYLITQYISERIKNNGYDGIAYRSSVYDGENNINLVVFNYDKCEAIDSDLYRIKSFKIEFEPNIE